MAALLFPLFTGAKRVIDAYRLGTRRQVVCGVYYVLYCILYIMCQCRAYCIPCTVYLSVPVLCVSSVEDRPAQLVFSPPIAPPWLLLPVRSSPAGSAASSSTSARSVVVLLEVLNLVPQVGHQLAVAASFLLHLLPCRWLRGVAVIP